MTDSVPAHALDTVRRTFDSYRTLGAKAIEQLRDGEWNRALDPESNSVAVIVKHMWGNMRSRWTDFLTSDGEKPWRERDAEFEAGDVTREQLMAWWNDGWAALFAALDALGPDDLLRTVTIRSQPLTVTEALLRQVAHYSYHVGQIVLLAKHARSSEWQTLSIARNASRAYVVSDRSVTDRPSGAARPPGA